MAKRMRFVHRRIVHVRLLGSLQAGDIILIEHAGLTDGQPVTLDTQVAAMMAEMGITQQPRGGPMMMFG